MCLLTCTLSTQLLVAWGTDLICFVSWCILNPQQTTSHRASSKYLLKEWKQRSLSWLSNGFKLPKPQQDPRQCHLPGSPTSSRREQHCACSKCTVSPSPVLPAPAPGPCLYSTRPCLCERSKRSHRTLFFILFPEKWANSQLQTLGEFPVWESGKCQEWRAAASQRGLCCHWPKQQQKQPQPPPPPQQNMPRGHGHTQTRPQNQTKRTRLRGGASGLRIPAGGTSLGPAPRQPHSQPPTICQQRSAYCKCAGTGHGLTGSKCRGRENKALQAVEEGGEGSDRNWQKAGKFKRKVCPEDLRHEGWAGGGCGGGDGGVGGCGDAGMQGGRLAVCGEAGVVYS